MGAEVPLTLLLDAFGIPATVTPLGGGPIVTRGIWVSPSTAGAPAGFGGVTRRETFEVLAFRRVDVPDLKRGSQLVAVPHGGTEPQRYRVDGFEMVEAELWRVMVVPDPEAS